MNLRNGMSNLTLTLNVEVEKQHDGINRDLSQVVTTMEKVTKLQRSIRGIEETKVGITHVQEHRNKIFTTRGYYRQRSSCRKIMSCP